MGHEDFSLTQVVIDFTREKWPSQPFKPRRELKGCSPLYKPLSAIDYDHYGIEWPFIYVVDDVVYVAKDFDVDAHERKFIISAADPQFFDKLTVAIEEYLKIISQELFLP